MQAESDGEGGINDDGRKRVRERQEPKIGKEQSMLRKKDRRLWREVGGSEKGDLNVTR